MKKFFLTVLFLWVFFISWCFKQDIVQQSKIQKNTGNVSSVKKLDVFNTWSNKQDVANRIANARKLRSIRLESQKTTSKDKEDKVISFSNEQTKNIIKKLHDTSISNIDEVVNIRKISPLVEDKFDIIEIYSDENYIYSRLNTFDLEKFYLKIFDAATLRVVFTEEIPK